MTLPFVSRIEKGHNHFEVLPEGWIKVTHNSGLPIFLHKVHRVCTLARPYFLGPGSVRKHEIPISAIPCLNYRKALEKEAKLPASCHQNGTAEAGDAVNGVENEVEQRTDTDVFDNNGCENGSNGNGQPDNVSPEDSSNSSANRPEEESPEQTTEVNGVQTIPNTPALPGCLGTAKIETVTENTKAQSLTVKQITDYCKSLFVFKQIRVMRFK